MLLSCRWPRPEPQHGLAALTALGPLPATAGQGSGGGEAAERPNHAVQRRAPRRAARTVRRSPHRRGCAYPARPAPRAADPGDSPTPGFPGPVSPVPCPESRGRGGGGRAPPRGVSGHLMARAPPPRRSPSARGSRGALEQSRGRARHGRAGQGRTAARCRSPRRHLGCGQRPGRRGAGVLRGWGRLAGSSRKGSRELSPLPKARDPFPAERSTLSRVWAGLPSSSVSQSSAGMLPSLRPLAVSPLKSHPLQPGSTSCSVTILLPLRRIALCLGQVRLD